MRSKINNLIKRKEKELNIHVFEKVFDENRNLHVLCLKESDGSYVVWTSYYTKEAQTSYKDFYNGEYDLTLRKAIDEIRKRAKRAKPFL
ncbi:hypothetical protein D7X33_40390 [Butyricicoccus sp. 1XD8-22]|nr:hypothetical protein D7X33_40390 [Butyricicoccus sp. 1XD8-22]